MYSKRILSIALVMMMLMSSISGFALTEDVNAATELTPVYEESIDLSEDLSETEENDGLKEGYWAETELEAINDNPTSGTIGKISWSLSSSGMLTISGTGSVSDFTESGAPWNAQKQYIRFIYISDGITSIGSYAFNDLSDAKSAYIPDSVKYIGAGAFQNCSNLKEIALPKDLKTISDNAFSNCSSVKEISIPKSVTYIGNLAFSGCEDLKEITVNRNNKTYMAVDGVLFNKSGTTLICYPDNKKDEEYVIPEGVTAIADYAFDACENLTNVVLPSTLKTIGKGAFTDCDAIKAINIPASVTEIAQDAFLYGMDSLAEINVDENNSVYSSESGVLLNKDKTKLIRFPAACEEPCTKGEYIMPKTVKIIGQEAFLDCHTIEYLWVHGVLEKIEMAAFMYFDSLQEIWFDGTQANWDMVEKDIFNEKLDEVYVDCMVGVLEEKSFQAKTGVTYYLEDFVDIKGNEDVLKTLVVSSSDNNVATVNVERKTMTAISEGEAIITAVAIKDGATYAVSVKVIVSSDVSDSKEGTYTLTAGDTLDLKAALSVPDEFLNTLTWNTSDSRVVTVDNGVVTAIGKGKALVIATVNSENMAAYSIRCEISVEPKYTDEKYFKFSNGTITDYTGPDSQVIIPPTIGGVAVKTIGSRAFADCKHVTKIELPETVTRIDTRAFYNCTSLSNIILHEGITYIGDYAFLNCTSLVKIKIPSTVTSTGVFLFSACTKLNTVEFASGTKTIGQALRGSYVKNVVIPSTVTTISAYAFYGCSNLASITVPDSVVSIGYYAFYNCSGLKTAKIGKKVSSIGAYAFGNCSKLTTVSLGTALTSLSSGAFSGCSSLTTITIPDKVSEIGSFTFMNCTALKTVTLGAGVKTINVYAFNGCSNLESINLPTGLTSIAAHAFNNNGLKSIEIPDTVISIGDGAFSSCENLSEVKLGSGITEINNSAFSYTGVTSITIPDSVKTIHNNAFYRCSQLSSITLGNKVTHIGKFAFEYCSNLKTINIPNSVTIIGNYAFAYTALTKIAIPDSVKTLGENVFYGCSYLTDVTLGSGFENISANLFAGCNSIKNVTLAEGVKTIKGNVFKNCYNLEKINIPNSVTSIGSYAFYGCNKLKEVSLGSGLKSIGAYAFYYCKALPSITIPDSVTTIGAYSFYHCDALNEVNLGTGITSIYKYAFYYCKALESIAIPDSVTSIGGYAFGGCSNLKHIDLGMGLRYIDQRAFRSCTALESIVIPANVTSVADYAFAYCTNLSDVQIENPSCYFGYNVFYECNKLNKTNEWTASYKALSEEYVGYFPMQIEYNISGNFITERKIIVNLPTDVYVVPGSMKLDGVLYNNYDADKEYRVTIPVENDSGVLTFCIKPSKYATISTTASMSVKSLGKTTTRQIGQVYLSMPEITINSVDTTGKADVIVEGFALPRKNVDLYIDDVYAKTVRAASNGMYKTSVSISNPENYHDYKLTASVINDNNEKVTADTTVKYIGNTPDLEGLVMYYGRNGYQKSKHDLYNAQTRHIIRWGDFWSGKNRGLYSYAFVVDISNRETIDKVYVVSSRNGQKEYLEAVWNESLQKYVTSGYFADDCEHIPGVLSVEYTKANSNEKLNLSEVSTYLDFETESFTPSVTDYTSESFSATVAVSETLKDVFGSQINISSETIERDYSFVSDVELYPEIYDYYSFPLTQNGNEYVIGFDCTNASNLIIYVHDLTNNKQTAYTMSFSNVAFVEGVEEGIEESLIISEILEKLGAYADNILDVYNLNVDTDKLADDVRILGLDQSEMDKALEKAENLNIKKQMFVLSSIVLSASSIEGVSAPVELLDCLVGIINQDIEYFKALNLANIFKIGSEFKIRWLIDPSGYVYEGVTDNRIEGVTATLYYIPSEEVPSNPDGSKDLTNIDESKAVVWDAEESGQQNPLLTGANGEYQWYVEEGLWQVKYEKEGYEPACSGWLAVPPPQLDVNIGLVSTAAPKVEKVSLTQEYATVTFDQYMKPSTITNVKIGDAEYTVEYDNSKTDTNGNVFAKEFTFRFKEALPFSKPYTVSIEGVEAYSNKAVESYSQTHTTPDAPMANELFLTNTSVDSDTVNVEYFNNINYLSDADTGLSFNIICTVYNEDGALVDLEILPVENVKKGETVNKSFTFITPFTNYKVFTWSSFENLEPMLINFDSSKPVQ